MNKESMMSMLEGKNEAEIEGILKSGYQKSAV